MKQNFDKFMSSLLEHEGGYVNSQGELGGLSDIGITKRTCVEFTVMVLSQVKLS